MKLNPNDPDDKKFMQKTKDPKTGRTLWDLHHEAIHKKGKQQDSKIKSPPVSPKRSETVNKLRKKQRFAKAELNDKGQNKTEAAYDEYLHSLFISGGILWYSFESMKMKLGKACYYNPDFAVVAKDGVLEFHEVKGYWMDDAKVKIKAASNNFPFRFIAVFKLPKKNGGGWKFQEF